MVWYRGRNGSLSTVSRLFRWLPVLVTYVLGGPGATWGRFGGFLVALLNVQLLVVTDGRVGEGHELVKHREFKLQLDAVDHRLQCSFDHVDVGVLHGKEADIHPDDD